MKTNITERTFVLIGLLIASALILLVGLCSFLLPFTVKWNLDRLQSETGEIPAFSIRGELYCNNKTVPISYLIYNEDRSILYKETFCIYEEKAYFLYSDSANDRWVIASIHLDSLEIRDECVFHTQQVYNQNRTLDYRDRNGYYYENCIVLNDKDKVVVFEVTTSERAEYLCSEFDFPTSTVQYNRWSSNSIELQIDSALIIYSLETMAQHSVGIEKVYSYQNETTWNGDLCLSNFFGNNSVQVVESEIYVVGELRDFFGEAYAIVLQLYDGQWRYIGAFHSSDYVNGKSFVIPTL